MTFDDDLIACAQMVERADPDRFRALMATPVAARAKLFPIYAFNIEAARAPWVTQETMIAEMRLQWWRDALEEIRSGATVRRHEVVTPLAGLAARAAADGVEVLRVPGGSTDSISEALQARLVGAVTPQRSGSVLYLTPV